MKKIIALLLIVLLTVSLFGCGESNNYESNNSVELETLNEDEYSDDVTDDENENEKDDNNDEDDLNIVDFDWTNISYTIKDTDGYKYSVSIKISPWILNSNSDTLQYAWEEVDTENELPQFDDWNLEKNGNMYRRDGIRDYTNTRNNIFAATMNDMYYSVGSISVENKTKGWNISESEPRSLSHDLGFYNDENIGNRVDIIGRIFYSSETNDYYSGISINPSLESNSWGPCSFVLMTPENFSPKYSKGEYYKKLQKDIYTQLYSNMKAKINGKSIKDNVNINLGVIGKDGKYKKAKIHLL